MGKIRFSNVRLLAALVFVFAHTGIVYAQSNVQFSHAAGYYNHSFELTLSATDADAIYYTLDGSVPDSDAIIYSGSITLTDRSDDEPIITYISEISHGYSPWVPPSGDVQLISVVRARSIKDGNWGKTITQTYIISDLGDQRYTLPVVSLVTDPENLFDYETGIYVLGKVYDDYKRANPTAPDVLGTPANYTQRGDEWERPAHFELIEPGGVIPLSMDIGIRMHGGGSRSFQQKTFRLYSRSDYGTSRFRYQMFQDQDLANYNRLLLRNSGQDWMKTTLRDGFMQTLVRHLPFETMAYRPAVLFLNGEFWGIANIRERYDKHYISGKFGVPDDEIDYLTGNMSIEEGSVLHYRAMIHFIEDNDLSNDENYKYVQTLMDTESFKYYNLANIYFNNRDWPHNNIDYWRYQTEYDSTAAPGWDGRWRWMMFDTDFGFAWTDQHDESRYQSHARENALVRVSRENDWSTFLLRNLLKNESFKREFINSYRDLMNTTFRQGRVIHVLDSLKTSIEPHINEHIDRWGNSNHRWSMPKDVAEWHSNLDYMYRFARDREGHVNSHFRDKFNLSTLFTLRVKSTDQSMGYIRVNNIDIRTGTPGVNLEQYDGLALLQYFNGIPVQVRAIPYEGFEFSHWEHDEFQGDEIEVIGTGPNLLAHFRPVGPVSIDEPESGLPSQTAIQNTYPNPFNPVTQVEYTVSEPSQVSIQVLDITGRILFTLINEQHVAGTYHRTIDMSNFASGIYFIRLSDVTGRSDLRKMSLIK